MSLKRRFFTLSAFMAIATATVAAPASAMISSTDAESNDTTDAVARIFMKNKKEMDDISSLGVHTLTCTGSLIDPEWVATATHCIPKEGLDKWYADISFGTDSTSKPVYTIDDVKVYSPDKDIALFHLDKPVKDKKPLEMKDGSLDQDTSGTGYGWGPGEKMRLDNLNTLEGTMSSKMEKDKEFSPGMDVYPVIYKDGISTMGDSGGPFIIDGKVYGILTYGETPQGVSPIGHKKTMYMPAYEYKDWIEKTVGHEVFSQDESDDDSLQQASTGQQREKEEVDPQSASSSPNKKKDNKNSSTSKKSEYSPREGDSDTSDDASYIFQRPQPAKGEFSRDELVEASDNHDDSISYDKGQDFTMEEDSTAEGEAVYGPKVNTGGVVERESFFNKIKSLFS